MAWIEKYGVWSNDGPYFLGRRDTESGAADLIMVNQPSFEPTKLYVMKEYWYEEDE